MKVLHIIDSIDESVGGPARSVPLTCTELARLGVEVEILTLPCKKPVKIPETTNLKVRFLTFSELSAFAKKLTRKDADLIHLQHIWNPNIHVMARAARHAQIPYLITPRGMLEPWILKQNAWKKKLAMFLYQANDIRKADLIHATCEMEKDNIRALGFKTPISVIPNGLNLSEVPAARAEFGNRKVVFLSRIHPKKGIELLLEAWKQLDAKKWTLDLAGDGDALYISELEQKIKRENIRGVRYVGAHYGAAKWSFLKTGDLFVLPTYSENFGIAIAESLAVGVPVITTTGTPWQELNSHHCGWWIDLSVDELVKALTEAIQLSGDQLQAMGQRGRALIIQKYAINRVAGELLQQYHSLINPNR